MTPALRQILLGPPFNPLRRPDLAAAYDARTGVTADSTNRVSAWADLSGKSRPLLQATGANQPLWLPYSGNKYIYLPGVAGNYASTPDSVAVSITGTIDIRVKVSLDSWTPSVDSRFVAKRTGTGADCAYDFYLSTAGTLGFYNGVAAPTSTVAVPFSSGDIAWVRVTRVPATGEIRFYTSLDGSTWTQLGNTISVALVSLNDTAGAVEIGTFNGGAAGPLPGRLFYAEIRNGIDGPVVAKFDANEAANNATSFVSSTGETWTINKSGARPAQIVGSARLLFDGSNYFQKTAAFTLGQPTTVYLLAHPVTYTSGDYLTDGDANDTLVIEQFGTTPDIDLYAGNTGPASSALTLANWHVISAVFNGASSVLQVDNGTPTTGNVGSANAGGFTLMARADGSGKANFLVERVYLFNTAHDARTRAQIYNYLRRTSNLVLP